MIGWFAQWGNYDVTNTTNEANGLFPLAMATPFSGAYTGKGDDIDAWMKDAGPDNPKIILWQNVLNTKTGKYVPTQQKFSQAIPQDINCAGGVADMYDATKNTNGSPMGANMAKFPDKDLFGNYTDLSLAPAVSGLKPPLGPGSIPLYKTGDLYKNSAECNKTAYDATQTTNPCHIGLASWTAAVHQAWKIWNQIVWDKTSQTNKLDPGTYQSNPVIFTILFDHDPSSPVDLQFGQLVANDPSAPATFSTRVHGQLFHATDVASVNQAFADIASEILRLAQ
jgi:hypothetical protein